MGVLSNSSLHRCLALFPLRSFTFLVVTETPMLKYLLWSRCDRIGHHGRKQDIWSDWIHSSESVRQLVQIVTDEGVGASVSSGVPFPILPCVWQLRPNTTMLPAGDWIFKHMGLWGTCGYSNHDTIQGLQGVYLCSQVASSRTACHQHHSCPFQSSPWTLIADSFQFQFPHVLEAGSLR